MKIIKKAVTSKTRAPMMANHQSVNVKIFLSYPKRTKKRRRKKFITAGPNRYSISYPQTQPETETAAGGIPNQEDLYSTENLLDNTDPFMSSTSANPSASTSSPASFSSSWQPNTAKQKGNMNWTNLLSEFDDGGDLGMTETEDSPPAHSEKKSKARSRRTPPLPLSGVTNQSTIPLSASPAAFHSEEQLGIPVKECSFSIMQQDISTIKECSYYVILHNQGYEHGNLFVRLEMSPDGKNFVIQEEKELYPMEMLVLSPRHVARFTRLYIVNETKGKKSGLEEEPSLSSAQLDVYFQYKTSSSS